MANEEGIRRVKGLYAPNFGSCDLVMYGLAQALAAAMEQPGEGTAMFSDYVALAFSLTLCALTAASRPKEGTPAAASHHGRCSAPATSSTPTWQTIIQSPRSQMRVDCQPATSSVRLSKRWAYHPTDG